MIPGELISMMARRRLVAEVRTDTAIQALSVVDALAAAGVTSVEVSLTIPGVSEILTHLATRQDVVVGAGSVLDERQATEAISSGARFVASPIFNAEIIPVCRDAKVACVLGALTPTEIIAAQRAGAEMVKLFPVEALGGPMYLRALLRQLTHISVQVAGGFPVEHLAEYLELPVRTVALGTLLTPPMLIERGNWQAITNRARAFVDYVTNPMANAERFMLLMGATPQRPDGQARGVVGAIPTMPMGGGMASRPPAPMQPQVQPMQAPTMQPPMPQPMQPGYPPGYYAPQPPQQPPMQPQQAQPMQPMQPPTLILPPNSFGAASSPGATSSPGAASYPGRAGPSSFLTQDNFAGDDGEDEADDARPAPPSGAFRPWDSRPIEQGDDEDWLR